MNFTYKFTPDYSEIIASERDSGAYSGSLNLKSGEWIGKRKRAVATIPEAFRRIYSKYLTHHETAQGRVIGWFIEEAHRSNLTSWLKKYPDFYQFIPGYISIPQVEAWKYNPFNLFTQLKKLGRNTLTNDDVQYIADISKVVNGIDKTYAKMYEYKDTFYEIAEHPLMARFIGAKMMTADSLPLTCTTASPSLDWYMSIARAIINDGLDDKHPMTIFTEGEDFNASILTFRNYHQLIEEYYAALVTIGEYTEEPITEGFFLDYARVHAVKEALAESKLQDILDKRTIEVKPTTIGDYSYTQITSTDGLKEIANAISSYKAKNFVDFLSRKNTMGIIVKSNIDNNISVFGVDVAFAPDGSVITPSYYEITILPWNNKNEIYKSYIEWVAHNLV